MSEVHHGRAVLVELGLSSGYHSPGWRMVSSALSLEIASTDQDRTSQLDERS